MTCKQLIDSIVRSETHNGYDMDADAAREVSDSYTTVLREQLKRANECRYRNMAMAIQGDVHYVYSGDYAGDMTSTFGPDATYTAALRLYAQDLTPAEIARRLNISNKKVLKILVTAGATETEESRLYNQGLTVAEIAQRLGKTEKNVNNRIPYEKGIYNAEYPSKNALKIRKCRQKKGVPHG